MKTGSAILAWAALWSAGCCFAAELEPRIGGSPVLEDRYPERRNTFPGDVEAFADLTYASLAGYRPLILDLYKPSKPMRITAAGDLSPRRRVAVRAHAALRCV